MTIKPGDIVAPIGDGEDFLGRVVKNSAARIRVLAVYGDKIDGVVVRGSGVYNPKHRLCGYRAEDFTVSSL